MKLDQVTLVSMVDDDESVREAMKSLVCSFGYRVETFGSAAEFLQSAQVENTVVFTDVQMPGLGRLYQRLLQTLPEGLT
jgi:FixJ family two-component response regulator